MFRNITIYRISTTNWTMTAEELSAAFVKRAFTPCGELERESTGWTPPRADGNLVHAFGPQLLLDLTTEKKILPASVIKRLAAERAIEIENEQGFKPGRRQMKEICERVTDELLPKALSTRSTVRTWIDPVNGWLIIDTASAARADHVVRLLLMSIEDLNLSGLRTVQTPVAAMTTWLDTDMAPAQFTVDRDAVLESSGEGRGTVKYVNLTLEVDDICRHIASGKRCTQLGMTWNDRLSFVLTDSMTLKRVTPLDTYKESGTDIFGKNDSLDADERFDADFLLMVGNFNQMLRALVLALGGEMEPEAASESTE